MHLAEINVARTLYALDHPAMAEFIAQLDAVNALADADPGFVWRLKSETGGASSYVKVGDDDRLIVNLSVWRSIESLKSYVYRSHGHATVYRDRRRWFEAPTEASLAMWWIPEGTIPTVEEGLVRLAHIRSRGPTAFAFTFKVTFPGSHGLNDPTDGREDPLDIVESNA